MDQLQQFIFTRTYARYLWEENRRETWPEAVYRYAGFAFANPAIPKKVRDRCVQNILSLNVMPSMRALWTAGPAAEQCNSVIYNCAFTAIDDIEAFSEIIYLLMAGTGVGFSCEKKYVDRLPVVQPQRNVEPLRCCIEDSRKGWKDAVNTGFRSWWAGRDLYFDYSQLRPMGAPLKTMGGRSSGPDVLRQLMNFARDTIMGAQGRRLTPLEVHDICCEIASVVVVGGTRRSALISLSDLSDEEMRAAKSGGFHARRFGANNSATYYEKPNVLDFLEEWTALAKSGTGERGIANMWAARQNAPSRRKKKLLAGINPCGEIVLRDKEFCNLTEVIVKAEDDFESLRDKLTSATWMGVIQSTFTHFPHLSPKWIENCEDERLIGVSLSGQMDNPGLLTPEVLRLSREHVRRVAAKAAKTLGINTPAATTTTKPAGTTSQLCNSSAGLHPRWAPYYRRNIQISTSDPLYRMMVDQGVPSRPTPGSGSTAILTFPVAAPPGAITRSDVTAIEQLEWYQRVMENWCEHSASCTIYVDDTEWISVAHWVYEHFDIINGLSFFPKHSHQYEWAPYEECTQDEYEQLRSEFPQIDFTKLSDYEQYDETDGRSEFACAGGACEL